MATSSENPTLNMALEIQIFDGDRRIAHEVTDQTKMIIGRILSADFRIADARVSRIHALLERLDDGTLRLTDLASTHGTFVNGERIVEKVVSPKDEISFATLKARFRWVKAPHATQSLGGQLPPEPVVATRSQAAAPRASFGSAAVKVSAESPAAPTRSAEPSAIRSLKEIARTRGVLDPTQASEELEVTVYWENTILAIDHYRDRGARVTIGDGPGNTYIVPSELVKNHFELVRVKGQTAELKLSPSMKGSARVQGRMLTFEELNQTGKGSVTLSGQDIAKIQVGPVNFFLMFVPEPPPIPTAPLFDQGALFWMLQASFAALALLLLTLGMIYRPPIEGQVQEFPEKLRKILVEEWEKKQALAPTPPKGTEPAPQEKPENPKVVKGPTAKVAKTVPDAQMVAKEAHRGGNEGEGARERGREGKRGLPNAKHETGITNRPKVAWTKKVQDAATKAQRPGHGGGATSILDSLRNTGLGARLSKAAGTGTGEGGGDGGAHGNDPLDQAFSGVGGGGLRSGRGSGGSGLRGSGPGGGGTAVGVGGLGTKGFGGGAKGTGVGSIPGKGEYAIGTETAEVVVTGGLSREEIRRVVNAHKNEIDFCYRQELQKDPTLIGKISMRWSVAVGGRVTEVNAVENSANSTSLAGCMADKIRRWKFPSPQGGSTVEVNWPWTFRPRG